MTTMERVITFCVIFFHLGLVASFPFAFPGGYNIAYGEPQPQYQHYQSFAQPQPVYGQQPQYNGAVTASAQAFAGNPYNNAYQQLPSVVQTTPFVNGQRENFHNVLAPSSSQIQEQKIQEQIAAQIKEQQAKDAVQRLLNQLPSVNGPATPWTPAQATAGVHQQHTSQSPDMVNHYAQIYQQVVNRPQKNLDPQFLQLWKERLQTPQATKKKAYLVIYPDGRTEYVDKIDSVIQNYPNYVLVNAPQIPHNIPPPGVKQQSTLTVPTQQQNPTLPPQPPQKPQKSLIKPEPDLQQPQIQSTPYGPTDQSQPIKSPSNPTPQNPLESLILNSSSTPTEQQPSPVQQPSSVPQQPLKPTAVASADVNLPSPAEKPTNNNQPPKNQKSSPIPAEIKDPVPTLSNIVADASVNPLKTQNLPSDSKPSQPLSQLSSPSQTGQNTPTDKTQPQSLPAKDQPESQNPVPENQPQQPSTSNNQPQIKPPDSNNQPQSEPSKPEQQSLPQTAASNNQPQPETSGVDDQAQPKPAVPNKEPQPQFPNPENSKEPLSADPNEKPESQLSSPEDTKSPQDKKEAPSPSSVTQPQPNTANEDNEKQLQSSDKPDAQPQPQSTKPILNSNKDSQPANPSDSENRNSQPADKPEPQKTPTDDPSSDKAVAAKPNPSQGPGKIVVIDSTGLRSGDLPSIDSEILSNLFGDSPYTVIQFFLVKPERTIERNVTHKQFGDDHILEEVTQSDRYGDDEPVVTHESHLLKIPKLE